MARQYKRDARGRFASGGSSGRRAGGTLAARASLRKSRQKLAAKDPADASLKGTLSGRAQRAAVTRANKRLQQASRASRVTIAGARGGTLRRPAGYKPPAGGRAKPKATRESGALAKRTPELMPTTVMPRAGSARKEPKIADVMRENLRKLAEADARFLRDMEREFGIKFPVPKETPTKRLPPPPGGSQSGGKDVKISTLIRDNLRKLAQSDAQMLREIDALTRNIPKGPLRGSSSTRKIGGSKPRLSGGKSKPPSKGKPRGKGKPKS